MDGKKPGKLQRIRECLKNKDYSNPELASAKIISLCVIMLLSLLLLVLVVRVDSIEVTGDVEVFNESDIVNASGISVGGCLYTKPFFAISHSLKKNLPMVERVTVFKNPITRKVTINVKINDFEYFVQSGDKFYGVDKSLNVTDVRDSRLEFVSLGARTLTLPQIEQPVLGERLVFTATLDILDENGRVEVEGVEEYKFDYVTTLLDFFRKAGYEDRINAVFADEKFNIRVIMDDKYLVYVGRAEDLETKFEVVDAIMQEGTVNAFSHIVINVQNPAVASARGDETLNFDEYVIPRDEPQAPAEEPTDGASG